MSDTLRRAAGEAWAFRALVEHDAAQRFSRLAETIAVFDERSPLPALLRRAADDERRHAALCSGLSTRYGAAVTGPVEEPRIAPGHLGARRAALYEMVAACCITETESVATLTSLLAEELDPQVEAVLREIARDEVMHGRLGWAHLAREAVSADVTFLAPYVPAMLSGTVAPDFFSADEPVQQQSGLLRHGVLPQARKRALFVGTLEDVVFPGLERFGIDAGPARAWLHARQHSRPAAPHASP